MSGVPYIFGNATTSIPLSNLDANFNTGLTIGNTTVGLGNTVTTLGNLTLTNPTLSNGNVTIGNTTVGLGNTVTTLGNVTLNNVTINSGLLSTATIPTANGVVMVSGNMPAFSAYQSASITLTAATNVLISVQTKEFDTGTCFNNTSSPVTLNGLSVPAFAFMPNVAGYYQVNGRFNAAGAGTGQFIINLYKNGSVFKAGNNSPSIYAPIVSALVYLNGTTDYVQMYGYSSSGDSTSTGVSATYFQASMVRSA